MAGSARKASWLLGCSSTAKSTAASIHSSGILALRPERFAVSTLPLSCHSAYHSVQNLAGC